MKYKDIKLVDSQISMNDYVVNDIKSKHNIGALLRKFSIDKIDLFIIPTVIGTAISIGFLIAQVAKLISLSSTIATLTSIL